MISYVMIFYYFYSHLNPWVSSSLRLFEQILSEDVWVRTKSVNKSGDELNNFLDALS